MKFVGNQKEEGNKSYMKMGNNIKNTENMRLVIDITSDVWRKN